MKPVTPETTIQIENKLQDPANALSINSINGRLQVIGKSTTSSTKINIPNLDGSVTGVTLPSGYQGMFILPFASGTGGFTSSGLSDFYFIKEGVVANTDSTYGITRTSFTNNGKQYYTNSSGRLAKVSGTELRVNWGKNTVSGSWEKKGVLIEPQTYNILTTTWTTGATFGVTGALVENTTLPTSDYFWDTTTIPDGLSVWKLTEVTSGPNKENTAWIQPSSIWSPLNIPIDLPVQGVSFSNFMVSAFFTGPNKIAGITKDIVQIWLATHPSGTIKKSVYFNVSTCSPVAVSTGGITLIHYNTELYDNGWCRCFVGIGYTGATYPVSGGIPQFGFSTARPDGAGGYTYGSLLGASAGSLYFSGVKIDYAAIGDATPNLSVGWNTQRIAPTAYIAPSGNTKYPTDGLKFQAKSYPNFFYPEGSVTGGFKTTIFYDMIIHGAAGISSGSAQLDDSSSSGGVVIVNGRFLNEVGVESGQNYIGWINTHGLGVGGTPAWRGTFYNGIYQSGGVFGGIPAATVGARATSHYTTPGGERGYTYGERFKLLYTGTTGDQRTYFNGLTGSGTVLSGPTYPASGSAGQIWTLNPLRDKVYNILNWSWSPRVTTEAEGIAATSFPVQGVPAYKVSGGAGGYNPNTSLFEYIAATTSTQNNSAPRPPVNPYPTQAL